LKGDKGDIAILPQPLIKELTGAGMIVPETNVVLARAAAGSRCVKALQSRI